MAVWEAGDVGPLGAGVVPSELLELLGADVVAAGASNTGNFGIICSKRAATCIVRARMSVGVVDGLNSN